MIAALSLEFSDDLRAGQFEAIVEDLEAVVRKCPPEVNALFVKPQSSLSYSSAHGHYFGDPTAKPKIPSK